MGSTTIKVSTDTRDRLRRVAGSRPLEEGILEALDSMESAQFWKQAERAIAWRANLSAPEREAIEAREREFSALIDGGNWG